MDGGLRVADVVVGLSVASDLGKGLDDGQGLRACALSMRLAEHLNLPTDERATLYWVSLLRFVGCTATAAEMAAALGDELTVSAAFAALDPRDLRAVLRGTVASVGTRPDRALAFLTRAPAVVREHETASCEVAQLLADRLGLAPEVGSALAQVFERWDGKGNPGKARGEQIAHATRVWQVAHLCDLVGSHVDDAGGAAGETVASAVATTLRARAGASLDPVIATAAANAARDVLAAQAADASVVLAAEPEPHRAVDGDQANEMLATIGLVADLKAPFFLGHCERVSRLAAGALEALGRPATEVERVRRAGLVQDAGRVAISSRIWTKSAPLTDGEREQVRLHPYWTGRILARIRSLSDVVELATAHHERLDGSGYHRGLSGGALTPGVAVLAAADRFVSTAAQRPHRPAAAPDDCVRRMRGEVRAGRLPAQAAEAVLAAAGVAERPPRASHVLTERELAVLAIVARGLTNRAAARRLDVSPKTVNSHLEHVYGKLGVSTRAAAIVHAMQEGWLDVAGHPS